jgi:uncharacterized protein (TIGR03437 family)
VGLKLNRLLLSSFLFLFLVSGTLHAMPQLRLSNASVGPISIAVGQNGPRQLIEAWNAGDGSLSLTVTATEPWLIPSLGASQACTTREGTCLPVRIELQTNGLEKGIHSAMVNLTDPNAADAPQSIVVTVQMDGGVPDSLTMYVAPNGSSDVAEFETNSRLEYSVTTASGGSWLSMATEGAGSFAFVIPHRITAQHVPGLAEGTYNGNVNITGSSFAPDRKNVPVTLQVTAQPIADLAPDALDVEVAQDSVTLDKFVVVANRGLGALSVNAVTASTVDGGEWLTAELLEGTAFVKISVNPAGLAPGGFQGTVSVETNAVNPNHDIPVRVTVVAQDRPIVSFGGVVNNANFAGGEELPQGGIVSLFGQQLVYQPQTKAENVPLPTDLAGTSVFLNGVQTPLYFVQYDQIAFQIPYDAAPGTAFVQVVRDGQAGNAVSVEISGRAPRILTFLGNFAIAVKPDGNFAIPGSPARPGDVLVIYAIGFGQTSPTAQTGAGATADPLQWIDPRPVVYFGGNILPVTVTPAFVGLTPGFVGLYQINVAVPGNAPRGDRVPLTIEGPGYLSNQVEIAIQ